MWRILDLFQNSEPRSFPQNSAKQTSQESILANFQFQQSKKRKLNVAQIRFDSRTTELKFDLSKYIAKVIRAYSNFNYIIRTITIVN